MPPLDNLKINTGVPGAEVAFHAIDSTQGYLRAIHQFAGNNYEIQDYLVSGSFRGNGYGKELLKVALQHAKALGARAVTASEIVTRESVASISSVFGPENVTLEWLGDFAPAGKEPQGSARASLVYEIGEGTSDDSYAQAIKDSMLAINPTTRAFNEDIVMLNRHIHDYDMQSGGRFFRLSEEDQDTYQALHSLRHLMLQQRDRSERKIQGKEFGYDIKFADEINPVDYDYILAAPSVPSTFRIKEEIDLNDKKQVYFALEDLPFHKSEDIRKTHQMRPVESIIGNINFPVDRTIGVESFQSWSGRGLFLNDPNPDYSLEKIIHYARIPEEQFRGTYSAAVIVIVKDLDGNLWGIATNDGSHRAAAAKLRGDSFMEVSEIHIPHESDMMTIPLRV